VGAGASARQQPRIDHERRSRHVSEVLLSAAVVWEVAIKRALGKLDVPDDFAGTLLGAGALGLAVTLRRASAVADLPAHHRDPFDRIIIAQSRVEKGCWSPTTRPCGRTACRWPGSAAARVAATAGRALTPEVVGLESQALAVAA
jgi:PIN domain nuclease of toxin-antitoxin system